MTQQGLRQASARNLSGFATETNYNEDFLRLFDAQSIAAGTFNERQLRWINARLASSYTNLNEAMQAYATSQGAYNWSSMGTLEDVANFTRVTPFGSTYARSGVASGLSAAGVIQSFAANVPQQTDRGLALEPARTNLLLRSQQFDNAAWVKSTGGTGITPVVVANDAVAPDGTTTADKVTLSLNGGALSADRSYLAQIVTVVNATAYMATLYVKGVLGEKIVLRQAGAAGYLIHTFTGVWDRITRLETSGSTSATLEIGLRGTFGSSPAVVFHIWQADLQAGGTATSPILTTTTPATRGLPVFTETIPVGRTKALLTYADATTTLVTGQTPGGTFDYVTPILAASKGQFGASEVVTRVWQA